MGKKNSIIDTLFASGRLSPPAEAKREKVNPRVCRLWALADRPLNETGHLDDIAGSMKTIGQLAPAIVRPINDPLTPEIQYEVIAGQVRWRAAIKAGTDLDVIIRDISNDREAFHLMVVENEQRRDLSDYAKALRLQRALDLELYPNKVEMAKELGLTQPILSKILAFCDLDTDLRDAIPDMRLISANRGYEIVRACTHGYKHLVMRDIEHIHELPGNLVEHYKNNSGVPTSSATLKQPELENEEPTSSDLPDTESTNRRRKPCTSVKYISSHGKYLFSVRQVHSRSNAPAVIALSALSSSLTKDLNFIEDFRALVEKHLILLEPPK